MRHALALAVAAALVLAACSGDADAGDTTTSSVPIVTTSAPPVTNELGLPLATVLMNDLGSSMGAGDNVFIGDRFRVTPELEREYLGAIRGAAASGEIPSDLERYDDDELLYLGYFYCLALDAGIDTPTAAQGVVASILAERDAAGTEPETGDVALGLATVNYSGGSLCGIYNDATQAYIDTFRSG